jgi:hypothetical protein
MMTDRLFHNGAFKAIKYHSRRERQYFYLFKAQTLNVLPVDPIWKSDHFVPIDKNGGITYKKLGIAHGDDVRTRKNPRTS